MKKPVIAILIILLIAVLAIAGTAGYFLWKQSTRAVTSTTFAPTEYTADPNHKLSIEGWVPDWASADGLVSQIRNRSILSGLSPIWYEVKEDGSLINKVPANAAKVKQNAAIDHQEFIPSVVIFDHDLFSKVLENTDNLNRHVQSIVDTVVANNYDGIDLDYESTSLSDKELYFSFLQQLSTALHSQGKKLTVDLLAKWGDNISYSSLPETHAVQDWSRISPLVDEVRIMAYDYTFAKAKYPGPIAPYDWVKQVLDYAVTQIPRDKIVLGMHLYSYEWWDDASVAKGLIDPLTFVSDYALNSAVDKGQARSYTYSVVQQIISQNKGDLSEYQGEKIFRYQKQNNTTHVLENRVLVFIDKQGITQRLDLAKAYGIKGVAFWRLGSEADLLQPAATYTTK